MSISCSSESIGPVLILRVSGRLDAHGATEIAPGLTGVPSNRVVVVDLAGVPYLSSAGIRILLELFKRQNASGGRLLLAGVQPYCREVFRVAGLDGVFSLFEDVKAALAEVRQTRDAHRTEAGSFLFESGSEDPGHIEVLGHIEDVLAARITPAHVRNKTFSSMAYSLGLGGMGSSVEEVMPLMGEMMTMAGTMVWLPTDGNDTPDFLVPRKDSDQVVIRTGFNASIAGSFNEYIEFESASPEGTTLEDLYASLFQLARTRRPDYRGALGLAMRAEVGQVFGSGAVRAPIASQAPENGKWITDPSNYPAWFEVDDTPRHRDVTGLICGIGVDMDTDLTALDSRYLNAAFYLNPGNKTAGSHSRLHNHGVFFQPFPLGEKPWNMERETRSVVEEGQFLDMRHLFDKTTIIWALIGVVYVQDFRPEPEI